MTGKDIEHVIYQEMKQRAALLDFPAQEITPGTDFIKSGLYDSMAFIDLIVAVEQQTGVELDLEKITPASIATPAKMTSVILKLKHG